VNYVDANFVTALHFLIPGQTSAAEKFVRKNTIPLLFSELAELECRRAFTARTGKSNSENWLRLQSMISGGVWRREPLDWNVISAKSNQLIDRFGSRLKTGVLDTLHVAHALQSGCTRFLSFDSDSNARTLAANCRLKVYPELTASERARVVKS
jgi:predicted nucleic acid-binding protein